MREVALDKASYDEFVKSWFFEVVVPEYRLCDAVKTRIVGEDAETWEIHVKVTNAGTGRMPVEIAATKGERFPDTSSASHDDAVEPSPAERGTVQASESAPSPGVDRAAYRDARTTITLGAGESIEAVIRCDFEPEAILVDPDALVLQLQRKLTVHRF
jgi:hypothetical protein